MALAMLALAQIGATTVLHSELSLLSAQTPETGILVNVSVNLRETGNTDAFTHKWKRSFGSGHAALTLREDWREHLSRAVTEIGLAGVRYHGIFDDDMGPVVTIDEQGSFVYNWCVQDGAGEWLE